MTLHIFLDGMKVPHIIFYPQRGSLAITLNFCILKKASVIFKKYKAVTAVSRKIYNRLKEYDFCENLYLCENGVDEKMFVPERKERGKKLVIGWVGRPSGDCGEMDQHGYNIVLSPLMEKLRNDSRFEFRLFQRTYMNAVPHSDMVKYYNSIDVLIHTGHMTGTPNPIFEAASCGKAVICTTIGAAIDMIDNGLNGWLIEMRNDKEHFPVVIKNFIDKLEILYKDREFCESMGFESRKTILMY